MALENNFNIRLTCMYRSLGFSWKLHIKVVLNWHSKWIFQMAASNSPWELHKLDRALLFWHSLFHLHPLQKIISLFYTDMADEFEYPKSSFRSRCWCKCITNWQAQYVQIMASWSKVAYRWRKEPADNIKSNKQRRVINLKKNNNNKDKSILYIDSSSGWATTSKIFLFWNCENNPPAAVVKRGEVGAWRNLQRVRDASQSNNSREATINTTHAIYSIHTLSQ